MRYRTLGSTGFKVSEVGFGAWAIGGNAHGNSYGPTDDEASIAAIQKAVELGCNFFDTADVYGHGHSEELLGKVMKGRRADMIVATKVGGDFYHGQPKMNFNPDYVEFAVERSLERLGTDYVDLLQMHNPPLQLIRNPKLYLPFEKLKNNGRIRHYGVSIHNPDEGLEAMKYGRPESIQVVFNLLRQDAKEKLFEAATEKNVGIIVREPLANGFLTGKYNEDSTFHPGDIRHNFPREYIRQLTGASSQLKFLESKHRTLSQASIRFILDHKEISTVIPGAKGPAQSEQNMKSSNLPPLTGEELLRIKFLLQQVS
jgi:aryl-alcohol dehydrogenase-like predicted oxidoreductase